jgi:streptogramin lyase
MRVYWAIAPISCALLLSGCSVAPVLTSTSTPAGSVHHVTLKGMVHGGQNPINGAHVHLLTLNPTGYGGPGIPGMSSNMSSSLLTTGAGQDSIGYYVSTASDGSFTITGDYDCPADEKLPAYYYSTGGDSGSGANAAATLIATAPACDSTGYTVINEVSTVATGYAFAGFITDPLHVGSSGSTLALQALNNGGDSLNNLYNGTTGVAYATTPDGNGAVPQAKINTLANILAACINTDGTIAATPSPTPCYTLFENAPSTGAGASVPTDTATAAINIIHNPGANVANLFALQVAGAPFQPSRSTATVDFTIPIVYTATPALNSPGGLAIDGTGNVWVANSAGNSLTEFGDNGGYLRTVTTGSLNAPWGIAIDGSGNLWVSDSGANTISEFSSSGVNNGSSPFSGGGLTNPEGLAVDAQSHLWIANPSTNELSEFSITNGSPVSSTGITTGGLDSPSAVAIDDDGFIWVVNSGGSGSVSLFNVLGSPYTGPPASPFSGGGLDNPAGFAIDSNNVAWIANKGAADISSFSNAGASNSSGYSGGGLDGANSIAIDGDNNEWVVNKTGNSISEFTAGGTAISPATTGYTSTASSVLNAPVSIAVDIDGNVWVTNSGNNTITEFVGAGTPVVTPIVGNLISPYGDSAINRP